jgi:hypothetical protein
MLFVSRVVAVAFVLLAAVALVRSQRLGWGAADAPDGTRYKVSPLTLSHVLQPAQPVSATEDCRLDRPAQVAGLCAVASDSGPAWAVLRLVPLVLLVAAGAATGAGVSLAAKDQRLQWLRTVLLAVAALLAVLAPALFGFAAPRALQVLHGLEFGVGGTLGTLQVALAATALAGLAAGQMLPGATARSRETLPRFAAVLLPPALAFVMMFPLPGALGFLTIGLTLGLVTGWAVARPPGTGQR